MEYLTYECAECGKTEYIIKKTAIGFRGIEYVNFSAAGIQVDHMLPVKDGGSGCWLGNYQFLFHKCNTAKNRKIELVPHSALTLF